MSPLQQKEWQKYSPMPESIPFAWREKLIFINDCCAVMFYRWSLWYGHFHQRPFGVLESYLIGLSWQNSSHFFRQLQLLLNNLIQCSLNIMKEVHPQCKQLLFSSKLTGSKESHIPASTLSTNGQLFKKRISAQAWSLRLASLPLAACLTFLLLLSALLEGVKWKKEERWN